MIAKYDNEDLNDPVRIRIIFIKNGEGDWMFVGGLIGDKEYNILTGPSN